MTRRLSPKLAAYVGLAALGLLAGLALGRPEPVVLGAPFALLAGVGLALAREPELSLRLALERDRVLEGDEVELVARAAGAGAFELELVLPGELELVDGRNPVWVRPAPGQELELRLRLRPRRFGAYGLGTAVLRAYSPLRLVAYESRWTRALPLRVYPLPETLRRLARPHETQLSAGNQVARAKGDGIEFADLRGFQPGDRIRRINWRASARRGELIVNELHPERNADVVVLLDSFAEARRGETGTLDRAVRAAYALADEHLRQKDRVGLVSFGGLLNWLVPGGGSRQLYRIADALLESEIVLNYAWKDVELIPRRTLPPQALVLCLSPLLDERAARALLDLRARRFDLAVVEISPLPFVVPGRSGAERLAYRVWRLRREALASRLVRAGIPVVVWDEERPLVGALEEVKASRRGHRRVLA